MGGGGGNCSRSFLFNCSQLDLYKITDLAVLIDQMKPGRIWSTKNEAGAFRKVDVS